MANPTEQPSDVNVEVDCFFPSPFSFTLILIISLLNPHHPWISLLPLADIMDAPRLHTTGEPIGRYNELVFPEWIDFNWNSRFIKSYTWSPKSIFIPLYKWTRFYCRKGESRARYDSGNGVRSPWAQTPPLGSAGSLYKIREGTPPLLLGGVPIPDGWGHFVYFSNGTAKGWGYPPILKTWMAPNPSKVNFYLYDFST